MKGLKSLTTAEQVARKRGKRPEEVAPPYLLKTASPSGS
jgi:hypothetical protein